MSKTDTDPETAVDEAAEEKAEAEEVEEEKAEKAEKDGTEAGPLKVVKAAKEKVEKAEKATDDEADERRPSRLPRDRGALTRIAVVLVLVAAVATAGLQGWSAYQAGKKEDERREVRTTAGEFGRALLSYDHTKLQAARDRVLAMASDDFAKTYDEAFTGGLEGVITRLKANATATVRSVYVGDITGGTAKVVVVMDSEVRSTAGTRRVLGSYLDIRLARHGDGWRITDVTSVGSANESMTDPEGKQTPAKPEVSPSPSK